MRFFALSFATLSTLLLVSAAPIGNGGDVASPTSPDSLGLSNIDSGLDQFIKKVEARSPFIGGLLSSVLGCKEDSDWSMPKPGIKCNNDNLSRYTEHCKADKAANDPVTLAACLEAHQCPAVPAITEPAPAIKSADSGLKRFVRTIKTRSPFLGGILGGILGCKEDSDWSMPKPGTQCNADNLVQYTEHCKADKAANDPITMAACLDAHHCPASG